MYISKAPTEQIRTYFTPIAPSKRRKVPMKTVFSEPQTVRMRSHAHREEHSLSCNLNADSVIRLLGAPYTMR